MSRLPAGFSERFWQYIADVLPGGGNDRPDLDETAEAVLFVVNGTIEERIAEQARIKSEGGYAFLPPACWWSICHNGKAAAKLHWIRKT